MSILFNDALDVLRAVANHFDGTDAPLGAAARDVLRRAGVPIARDYHCPLCGQHITDGKPCGCGARGAHIARDRVPRTVSQRCDRFEDGEHVTMRGDTVERDAALVERVTLAELDPWSASR